MSNIMKTMISTSETSFSPNSWAQPWAHLPPACRPQFIMPPTNLRHAFLPLNGSWKMASLLDGLIFFGVWVCNLSKRYTVSTGQYLLIQCPMASLHGPQTSLASMWFFLDMCITIDNGRMITRTYQNPINIYLYIPQLQFIHQDKPNPSSTRYLKSILPKIPSIKPTWSTPYFFIVTTELGAVNPLLSGCTFYLLITNYLIQHLRRSH